MWATYRKSLNDRSEQIFGYKIFEDLLLKRCDKERPIVWSKPSRHFVICFCDTENSLPMWQSYAHRGGGYCIEFGPSIINLASETGKRNWVFKLRYGHEQAEVVEVLNDLSLAVVNAGGSERVKYLSLAEVASMILKHPAFEYEQEWRILTEDPDPAKIDFHSGHSDIKAHIDCWLGEVPEPLPIRRVIVGPTLRHGGAVEDVVQLMLQKYGYPDVKVERCNIPLQ